MREDDPGLGEFQEVRPVLMGLAYRILGSSADAADAVQDTYLAWHQADRGLIRNARAWLISVCARRCIDMAGAANRSRVDYVGTWLPEPVHTASVESPEELAVLASSVTTAFLLLLERLTPKERAAYLLREVFEHDYSQVAATLGMQEAACRQLVARARRHIGRPVTRHRPPSRDRQRELLNAFRQAIRLRTTDALAPLLAADVQLVADGGGKVAALRETLRGRREVLAWVSSALAGYWSELECLDAEINAEPGLEVWAGPDLSAAVSFDFDDEGRVRDIFIMRNPDKLARLAGEREVLS